MFKISDNDLNAKLNMPQNFLLVEPMKQISIIHGLREQFSRMELGSLDLTSSYDTDLHKRELIANYADLFPLESFINVDFDSQSQTHTIQLSHDKRMLTIPQVKQPVFVALVIAALTSAGTYIVASCEGMI